MRIWYSGGKNKAAIIEPGYDRRTELPESLDEISEALEKDGYRIERNRMFLIVNIESKSEYDAVKASYLAWKRKKG